MAIPKCAACGCEVGGSNSPVCSASGGAHRLDRVGFEKAQEKERLAAAASSKK
jgi:hypothetical protein